MKVIYEPEIEPYPPDLYRSDCDPSDPVKGWNSFDTTAAARYATDGYIVVCRAITADHRRLDSSGRSRS